MANPQKENGYTAIANELIEALAKFRIPGEARQMLDVIFRKTYGYNKKKDQIATTQFSQLTGLQGFIIHRARKRLLLANLIIVSKNANSQVLTYEIQKDYKKWKVLAKKHTLSKKVHDCKQKSAQTVTNIDDDKRHKDNYTKEKNIDNISVPQATPDPNIQLLLKSIYDKGFNIYKLLGRFKKERGRDLPAPVLEKVCQYYLINTDKIENEWAWFLVSCKRASEQYFAEQNIKQGQEWKNSKAALSLKEIMAGAI